MPKLNKIKRNFIEKFEFLEDQDWNSTIDPTGWWMSAKIEGIRVFWDGKTFWTKAWEEIIPPNYIYEQMPKIKLDGILSYQNNNLKNLFFFF
jgi:hypothetical protein